jgi:Domain of unknown function (DUF4440)
MVTGQIGPPADPGSLALREAEVLAAEGAVWAALQAGDANADRELLAADFLGVYASGLGDREAHAAPLNDGPRVRGYRLLAPRFLHLAADCILINYEAVWERAASPLLLERTRISSIWQQQADGRWMNRFSQDTTLSD